MFVSWLLSIVSGLVHHHDLGLRCSLNLNMLRIGCDDECHFVEIVPERETNHHMSPLISPSAACGILQMHCDAKPNISFYCAQNRMSPNSAKDASNPRQIRSRN
eukprot:765868_1